MSLDCHVDLDSLWMVYWEDRRNDETGSRAGVSDWRSILLCCTFVSSAGVSGYGQPELFS